MALKRAPNCLFKHAMGDSRNSRTDRLGWLAGSALASRDACSYPESVEIHLTAEEQAQLAQIARKVGTAPERLVTKVVTRYLGEEARFLAAVEKGLAAAERGEFIEEEEMDARLEAMFKP